MRVLVTRPEPGASRTAEKLRTRGFEPVILPLSETRPIPISMQALPADAVAVAVTSANALRHAPLDLIQRLANLPCHAVGHRTGEATRAAGFVAVEEGPGNAVALAGQIGEKFDGGTLVYLCGRERFPGFEERLAAIGVQVHPIETYETVAMDHSDAAVLSRLGSEPVDALLLYSANAAMAARELAARPALRSLIGRAGIHALSQRIARAYGQFDDGIHVASAPTEEALLALLAKPG